MADVIRDGRQTDLEDFTGKPVRARDQKHLAWVRRQPCLICGGLSIAHHLMFSQPSAMGLKSSDHHAVPLCPAHHQELHATGDEQRWWAVKGVDPMQWLEKHAPSS